MPLLTVSVGSSSSSTRLLVVHAGETQRKPWRRSTIYSPDDSKKWKQSSRDWGISPVVPVVDQRKTVTEFLEKEGIRLHITDHANLPPSFDIVQERMDFLMSIGLEKDDILDYPQLLCYSVQRNMVPVVNYLEQLGITSEALPGLLRRFPMVLHSSVVVDLKPVVDYLLGYGVREEFISVVLNKYPELLGFKLEGTMSTSVAYLISLGVHTRKIGPMITLFPEFLGMKVGNNIKPKVEYFTGLGLGQAEMIELLEGHPYVLGYDLDEEMKPTLACLVKAGIPEEQLPVLVSRYPDVFSVEVELKLAEKAAWLWSRLSVRAEHLPSVVQKLPQFLVLKEQTADERIEYLIRETGLSAPEIGKMVVICPQILGVKFEKTLVRNLQFFMSEMNRPTTELVGFPDLLTYSLGGHIKPRLARIRKKGIDCSLEWFLGCSNERFERRLDLEFLEEAPGSSNGEIHHETEPFDSG